MAIWPTGETELLEGIFFGQIAGGYKVGLKISPSTYGVVKAFRFDPRKK